MAVKGTEPRDASANIVNAAGPVRHRLPDPAPFPHSDGTVESAAPEAVVDWAFLDRQCCGDAALARELLLLFAASAARLVAAMPALSPGGRGDVAHRLRGSSLGIGAWAMARAAERLEGAVPADREAALAALVAAFGEAERAIRARLRAR